VHLEAQAHLEVRPGLALAKCGRLWLAAAGSGQLQPALAMLQPAVVRPSLAKLRPDLVRCGQTCLGAAGPAPFLWCTPLWFICPLLFPYLCTYK
jgi:hypothetical protein